MLFRGFTGLSLVVITFERRHENQLTKVIQKIQTFRHSWFPALVWHFEYNFLFLCICEYSSLVKPRAPPLEQPKSALRPQHRRPRAKLMIFTNCVDFFLLDRNLLKHKTFSRTCLSLKNVTTDSQTFRFSISGFRYISYFLLSKFNPYKKISIIGPSED